MNSRKAQMQMSIGTIVTIVLLMTVLILGLVLVRTIFGGAIDNVNDIDQAVKSEITKLFSEDDSRKVVVYPSTRLVKIKKGDESLPGFAFSIRNVETTTGEFTYNVFVNDPNIRQKCNINVQEAESWIKAGKSGSINIPPGSVVVDPEFVRFLIPDNAPPCLIRYGINVEKDNQQYGNTINVDLKVESK